MLSKRNIYAQLKLYEFRKAKIPLLVIQKPVSPGSKFEIANIFK